MGKNWKNLQIQGDTYDDLAFLKDCYGTSFNNVIKDLMFKAYGELTGAKKAELKEEVHQKRMKEFLGKLK